MISNSDSMKNLFVLFTILGLSNMYAHKNVTISETFGNIEVVFHTGYFYEEINKALIIGHYAEDLAAKMNFQAKITLYFKHNIGSFTERYYKLSNSPIDAENITDIYLEMKDTEFDIFSILKLIEYSISNVANLKGLENGSEGSILFKTLENEHSANVTHVLKNKIYRPAILEKLALPDNGISYYYKDDGFHVYRVENGVEKDLFTLENIYQIAEVDEYSLLLFDSKNSFYYITSNRLKEPSLRMTIDDAHEQVLPYAINKLSNAVISITFQTSRSAEYERIVLFDYKKDFIFQEVSKMYLTD